MATRNTKRRKSAKKMTSYDKEQARLRRVNKKRAKEWLTITPKNKKTRWYY